MVLSEETTLLLLNDDGVPAFTNGCPAEPVLVRVLAGEQPLLLAAEYGLDPQDILRVLWATGQDLSDDELNLIWPYGNERYRPYNHRHDVIDLLQQAQELTSAQARRLVVLADRRGGDRHDATLALTAAARELDCLELVADVRDAALDACRQSFAWRAEESCGPFLDVVACSAEAVLMKDHLSRSHRSALLGPWRGAVERPWRRYLLG